jgi:NAD(P)-dependent dehydrogenase (short-subunit alcohol dehydrogenase family)
MAKVFDATSSTDDVLSGVSLNGKRILVTGVSAGLGVETARTLAVHGAQVVGTARDLAKAKAATAHVRDARQRTIHGLVASTITPHTQNHSLEPQPD